MKLLAEKISVETDLTRESIWSLNIFRILFYFCLLVLFYFYFQNTTTADLLDSQFRESVHVPGFVLA